MSGHVVGGPGWHGRAAVVHGLLRRAGVRDVANLTVHWVRNTITPALAVLDELHDGPAKEFIVDALMRLRRLSDVYAEFGRAAEDDFEDGGGI